jgi:hypothetical protein
MVSEDAKRIIWEGGAKVRVRRAGMLQVITLTVRRVRIGDTQFVELYFKRMVDRNELARVANELGLPVEAENGRAFPEGKGAKDFLGL